MTPKIKQSWFVATVIIGMAGILITPALAHPEEEIEGMDAHAFEAMGYAMAMQMRLNIGFSDDELNHLFRGMTLAAKNGEEPQDFESSIRHAQSIYMQRIQESQAKEQAKAAEAAEANKAGAKAFLAELDKSDDVLKTESGLRYKVIEEGTGDQPGPSDHVLVSYRGTLIDGREFDSNNSAEFPVNGVVPGFSEGLQLMKEGGKIKLYIPSDLAYGDSPQRPGSIIEPGSTLIFDVQLVRLLPKPGDRPPVPTPTTPPQSTTRPTGAPNYTPPPPPNYTPPPPPPPPTDRRRPGAPPPPRSGD